MASPLIADGHLGIEELTFVPGRASMCDRHVGGLQLT